MYMLFLDVSSGVVTLEACLESAGERKVNKCKMETRAERATKSIERKYLLYTNINITGGHNMPPLYILSGSWRSRDAPHLAMSVKLQMRCPAICAATGCPTAGPHFGGLLEPSTE
jgi:hypothetical protein